jgi:hypothetical protein
LKSLEESGGFAGQEEGGRISRGIERTEGKERPGKEVRRTLMFAMVVTAVSIRRVLM